MNDGYSYTTISAHRGESTDIGVALHLDGAARITVLGIGRDGAGFYLGIRHCGAHVDIGPVEPTRITATDVQVARKLAEATQAYLAEVERLHDIHRTRAEDAA
jgi:hypothetical protein